jgi:hypothetical protein
MENPNNRTVEYDAFDDRYGRMLITELLPEVARSWRFADAPDRRQYRKTTLWAHPAFAPRPSIAYAGDWQAMRAAAA